MNKVIKKIPKLRWWYILPACFLTNFFAFMDRQVISIALPGGMMQDLALNATFAGFAAGITSIGYLFLQVYGGQAAQRGKAKKFIGASIVGWSVFSLLTAFVQNEWELYILRFLLGVTEGGLAPAVVTLLTYWFPDKDGERNRANSVYYTANAMAMILMGPIAGTLIGAYGWRELFLIIGGVSLLTAVLWMMFICERPEDAKWLSKEEKEYIITTIEEERQRVKELNGNMDVDGNKVPLKLLLTNKSVWMLMIISVCVNLGQFGFSMWVPTMLQTLTKAGIVGVGWLSALPSIASLIGLWTWSYIAKKVKDRRLTTGVPLLLFAITLVSSTLMPGGIITGITMICIVSFFIQAHMPSFFTLPSLLFVRELDGAARGLIGLASGIGAFGGPYLVGLLITKLGSTNAGMYVLASTLVIGFLAALALPKNLGSSNQSSTSAANEAAASAK